MCACRHWHFKFAFPIFWRALSVRISNSWRLIVEIVLASTDMVQRKSLTNLSTIDEVVVESKLTTSLHFIHRARHGTMADVLQYKRIEIPRTSQRDTVWNPTMASPPATHQVDPAVLRKLAARKKDASIEASSFEQDFRVTMEQSEDFKQKEKENVESMEKEKQTEHLSIEEDMAVAKIQPEEEEAEEAAEEEEPEIAAAAEEEAKVAPIKEKLKKKKSKRRKRVRRDQRKPNFFQRMFGNSKAKSYNGKEGSVEAIKTEKQVNNKTQKQRRSIKEIEGKQQAAEATSKMPALVDTKEEREAEAATKIQALVRSSLCRIQVAKMLDNLIQELVQVQEDNITKYQEAYANWATEEEAKINALGLNTLKPEIPDEVFPQLWIGSRHVRTDNDDFMASVTHLVDASNKSSDLPAVTCSSYLVELPDSSYATLPFRDVSDFIHTALTASAESVVFVHCNQGKSRSAALVIGYLILAKRFTLKQAFHLVKEKRKVSMPNLGFMKQLIDLEKETHSGETTLDIGYLGTFCWKKD